MLIHLVAVENFLIGSIRTGTVYTPVRSRCWSTQASLLCVQLTRRSVMPAVIPSVFSTPPNYTDCDRIIAHVISSLVASLRFGGALNAGSSSSSTLSVVVPVRPVSARSSSSVSLSSTYSTEVQAQFHLLSARSRRFSLLPFAHLPKGTYGE